MGRRKKLDPVQRARLNLSFNLSDPSQRFVYNYLIKQKGNATRVVTDAVLHSSETKETSESFQSKLPAPRLPEANKKVYQPPAMHNESVYTESYADISDGDFDDLDDALSAFGDA